MKRFSFPLGRVLSFRRRELDVAESHLKRTLQQESLLRKRAEEFEEEALMCRGLAAGRKEIHGAALRAAGEYAEALDEQRGAALKEKQDLVEQRRQQMERLIEIRRNVKLLEKLRVKRLRVHQGALNRQTEAETAELHLAKWLRRRS